MALVLADRVRETTTTTGTGSVTLAGAYTGFQTFSAGVGNSNSTYYTIANVVSGEYEVGIGTYTSGGNTLSRTTVLTSSNSGSLVNFGSGSKDVFVTQPAARAVYVDGTNVVAANSATVPNSLLANSSLTLGSTALTLGATTTSVAGLTLTTAAVNGTLGATTPASGSFTSLTDSGNLTFTGTGNRITGDFSNATFANRVAFQTSTVNSTTAISVIPNGTGSVSQLNLESDSAQANGVSFQILANTGGTEGRLQLGIRGTGTYLPMTFYTGGSERARIDTSGNVLVTSAAGLGYGTGSGGTVTQATSKSTAVTLNKPTGRITMNAASLASSTNVIFQLNNSTVASGDVVIVNVLDGATAGAYQAYAEYSRAGTVQIILRNTTLGALAEAVILTFAVIKGGVTS